jgi:hypothetical protein
MEGYANENRILKALTALLACHRDTGSVVLVEEPLSRKFVQFGPGWSLIMDVPHVALSNDEAERAYRFFGRLGTDCLVEYDAPDPQTLQLNHGATFNYDFGQDAPAAAQAATLFFQEVYLLPPHLKLRIEQR